jgi:hypothetical protein
MAGSTGVCHERAEIVGGCWSAGLDDRNELQR